MTGEQNKPVRSREDQISALWDDLSKGKPNPNHDSYSDAAAAHIDEAEARGAAEQRRKDAEGQERWYFSEPDYHQQGMGCGLEDRGIHDRYEAMEYGWDQAVERCAELIPEELYTNVAALEADATNPEGWQPVEGAPKDGTMVDLWVRPFWDGKARRVIDAWWTDRTGWRSGTEVPIKGKVTFWRSCPPAPSLTREGGVG